ncbi:MAG: hypothetical protein ABFS16_05660 [Bacteroidota bacterium]
MKDNDKNLKDMWNKAGSLMGGSEYESETIERFVSGRSTSVTDKIRKMLHFDIALKILFAGVLLLDGILYFNIQPTVSMVCLAGVVIAIPLAFLQFRILKQFNQIADYGQSTKEKLARTLIFLRNRFFTAILSTSSTGIFLYISGLLMYFFLTYGELRRLGNMDVFVFSTFLITGVVMNFAINYAKVKYHIKHIEACLSDLNDNVLAVVASNIETQLKQDRTTKMLLYFVFIFGFIVLIAVLKKLGF